MSMIYQNIKMFTVHTKDTEFNQKTGKHKKLKTPIVTERVHVPDTDAWDLGEVYELMRFATSRDPYSKVNISFTVHEEH